MAKASLAGTTIAESSATISLEGNAYFPPASVRMEFLQASSLKTVCPSKGDANYYDIVVGDTVVRNAAWVYQSPSAAVGNIKGHIAFYGDKVTLES